VYQVPYPKPRGRALNLRILLNRIPLLSSPSTLHLINNPVLSLHAAAHSLVSLRKFGVWPEQPIPPILSIFELSTAFEEPLKPRPVTSLCFVL
jgi:hypothetical protein